MDPGLAEAHAEFVARVVRSVGGAAVKDATVVHPQGAFFQIEADRVKTRIDFGAAAEQVVEFGRAAVFGHVLGTGNEFETAVLLVGIDQGEFGADGECRGHDSGKGGGLTIAMPSLILGARQRDIGIVVGPDVIGTEDPFEESDDIGVFEYILIDKRRREGYAHVVAAPTPGRILALDGDIGIANRDPGLENAVDFLMGNEIVKDGEPVDAKLHYVALEVVGHEEYSLR